jgi:hypothetical protein
VRNSCASIGRRWRCDAGGHSVRNTGLECSVPSAVAGGGGAWLRQVGADAGEGRA